MPVEHLDRRQRVALLRQAADALLRGELPDDQARLFLAGALSAWLASGGDLERSFLKTRAPRGSHHTPQRLAALQADSADSPAE